MDPALAPRPEAAVVAAPRAPELGSATEGIEIVVDGSVARPWLAATEAVRVAFARRSDLDPGARVEVLGAGDSVIVHVSLPDGRSTVRRVLRPEDLAMTVEVLVTVPPARPKEPPPPPPEPPPPPKPSPAPSSFEVGLGASAHLSVSPSYFGYGLAGYAQAIARRWLIGVTTRWDFDDLGTGQALPHGFNMQVLQVSTYLGRRVALGETALDVMVGPGIAIDNQEALAAGAEGIGGTRAEGIVQLGARLSQPAGSMFRLFVGLAVDVLPARVRSPRRLDPDLPPLPPWGLGLTAGASWEDR